MIRRWRLLLSFRAGARHPRRASVAIVAACLFASVLHPDSAGAQRRRISTAHLDLAERHSVRVEGSDSGVVVVTVGGGKFPLVAAAAPAAARGWAHRVLEIIGEPAGTRERAATPGLGRVQFGFLSDMLRFERLRTREGVRNVLAIDVGPNDLTLLQAQISPETVRELARGMERAADITQSITARGDVAAGPAPSASGNAVPPAEPSTPLQRCMAASERGPLSFTTGPSGYPAGTSLDELTEPALTSASARPVYPPSARGARVTGRVVTRFAVDRNGRPVSDTFRLAGGTSNPLFVQSVCEALPNMVFRVGAVAPFSARVVYKTFVIAPVAP